MRGQEPVDFLGPAALGHHCCLRRARSAPPPLPPPQRASVMPRLVLASDAPCPTSFPHWACRARPPTPYIDRVVSSLLLPVVSAPTVPELGLLLPVPEPANSSPCLSHPPLRILLPTPSFFVSARPTAQAQTPPPRAALASTARCGCWLCGARGVPARHIMPDCGPRHDMSFRAVSVRPMNNAGCAVLGVGQ